MADLSEKTFKVTGIISYTRTGQCQLKSSKETPKSKQENPSNNMMEMLVCANEKIILP